MVSNAAETPSRPSSNTTLPFAYIFIVVDSWMCSLIILVSADILPSITFSLM